MGRMQEGGMRAAIVALAAIAAIAATAGCGGRASDAGALPPTRRLMQLPAPPEDGGATIAIDVRGVLGRSNSRLLGTCRNHVAGAFPDGAAKLRAMRALRPAWGDRRYLYRIGHGPTDGRTDYGYMTGYHFERTWGRDGAYPYDDLRHGLADAAAMEADQIHVVNFGTGDPQEAGRYVSYLNKAGDANRRRYPVAQQNVRLFEIGNEVSWDRVRGHARYAPNETAYATRARQFARAMRQASDVPIRIGAVASTNSNWFGSGWSGGATTVKNIIEAMGEDVDFLIYHGYPSWPLVKPGDLRTIMAQNAWTEAKIASEIRPAIRATGRDVALANTEFFVNLYGDPTRSRGLFGALYNADSIALAMNERMEAAVEFGLSHGDMADAGFFFDDSAARPTPIYRFQELLARHWGDNAVRFTAEGLPSRRVAGAATSVDMPLLGLTASASVDGRRAWLMAINRTEDQDVTCAVRAGGLLPRATAYTLAGDRGWASADATVATKTAVALGRVTFPRASVTILEVQIW